KVFRLNPQIAVGFTTSFRLGQLIEHHVAWPGLDGDELTWAITWFVPALRKALKLHGYAIENNDRGGEFLLAVRQRLFLVQPDFSVLETCDPYDALGDGEDFAMGAMHALWERTSDLGYAFLEAALAAAAAHSIHVAPPYTFVSTTR